VTEVKLMSAEQFVPSLRPLASDILALTAGYELRDQLVALLGCAHSVALELDPEDTLLAVVAIRMMVDTWLQRIRAERSS